MRLILMRHAEAAPGHPDFKRQLTAFGLRSIAARPNSLKVELQSVDQAFVSPYLRTAQTFERLDLDISPIVSDLLVPESTPDRVCALLQNVPLDSTLLLVTHMPLVGWLSGYLTEGPGSYGKRFMPAQVEVLEMEYPAAGMAHLVANFAL